MAQKIEEDYINVDCTMINTSSNDSLICDAEITKEELNINFSISCDKVLVSNSATLISVDCMIDQEVYKEMDVDITIIPATVKYIDLWGSIEGSVESSINADCIVSLLLERYIDIDVNVGVPLTNTTLLIDGRLTQTNVEYLDIDCNIDNKKGVDRSYVYFI